MFLKIVPVTVAAIFSMSAFAVEKEIMVTAQIDPTVELLAPDGGALPSTLNMNHVPGKGLRKQSFDAKLFSNASDKDIEIRLQTEPQLKHTMNGDAPAIDLKVSIDGQVLAKTATKLPAAVLFVGDEQSSKTLTFDIEPKKAESIAIAGQYRGPVRLVITHAATAVSK